MTDRLPAGPYRSVTLDDGTSVPFYIIPFDKEGRCEGPQTRQHLIDAAAAGQYTHIFLFSHGWNNDWTVATKRYEDFLEGYMDMRRTYALKPPQGYKPLLVGVFWPSTALVFSESETGPDIAGDPTAAKKKTDERVGNERAEIRELAAELPTNAIARFYDLAQKDKVNAQEAKELAEMLLGIAASGNDEMGIAKGPSAAEVLRIARAAEQEEESTDPADYGTVGGTASQPKTAGLFDFLDPRHILRLFTVQQMKDRAGKVGANGVRALLYDLLSKSTAKLHLIGHSYGAKVVLSAVGFGGPPPRPVQSILLLQPAVSHLCFADNVPVSNKPGGYHAVRQRVAASIMSTFSAHDFPLRKTFHLALRREDDLGEARIAGDDVPSKYAALGGYGPKGAGEVKIKALDVNQQYALQANGKIHAIESHHAIEGHGDISNRWTWWALYSQTLQ